MPIYWYGIKAGPLLGTSIYAARTSTSWRNVPLNAQFYVNQNRIKTSFLIQNLNDVDNLNFDGISKGDMLYMDTENCGMITHATIIKEVQKSKKDLIYYGHTRNTNNGSLRDAIKNKGAFMCLVLHFKDYVWVK